MKKNHSFSTKRKILKFTYLIMQLHFYSKIKTLTYIKFAPINFPSISTLLLRPHKLQQPSAPEKLTSPIFIFLFPSANYVLRILHCFLEVYNVLLRRDMKFNKHSCNACKRLLGRLMNENRVGTLLHFERPHAELMQIECASLAV